MSPRLCLIDAVVQPKTKQKISAKCHKCGEISTRVFAELLRSVNSQAKYVANFHCAKCFRNLPEFKQYSANKASQTLAKSKEYRSKISKELWQNNEFRAKCEANVAKLRNNKEFADKVSKAIKDKFANDVEYVARVNAARRNNPLEFINKCSIVHDGLYDYSKSDYLGMDILFEVICKQHGSFKQLPSNHIKGHGCPQCAIDRSRLSADEYFAKCITIHDSKYDYSNSSYSGSLEYISYICPKHGEIKQLAQNHLKGAGCRFCSAAATSSAGENEVADFINSLGFKTIRNDRSVLDGQEIDILIDGLNIGVEFHGLFWHSYGSVESSSQRRKHFDKLNLALDNGVRLYQIYENEWMFKQHIVKSVLSAKLGKSNRIYARNCKLVHLSDNDASDFFNINHLNGHRKANLCLGLEHHNELVAVASFNIVDDNCELIRFSNKLGSVVVGALSRLSKHTKCRSIFSYADRRYSPIPSGYLSAGFKCLGVTQPGYSYCRGMQLYPRQMFQKHKLADKLTSVDPELTEAENMFNNGYRRIWDAGHFKMLKIYY